MSQEVKYWGIYPKCWNCGWSVKGTYEAALKFAIKGVQREGITEDKFPFEWENAIGHFVNGEEVIDQVTHHVANSYEELIDINEESEEEFLEFIDLETYRTKGKEWCLEHRDEWYEKVFI